MDLELGLTPGGHLIACRGAASDHATADQRQPAAAFATPAAAGLFALAAGPALDSPTASVAFWRDFAAGYLAALCRIPERDGASPAAIEPPGSGELDHLLLGAPPMPGGEYLSAEVLRARWRDLDAWVGDAVSASGSGLGAWLGKHAPRWRRVGRVCLHLAEQRNDVDYPFAFLATYAPRLSRAGQVQYQPLGRALEEYAGARDRARLANLLAPLHRAAERVALIRELVDSGDVFHPLAWTPAEAHLLLLSMPVLEECGLLMRVPDWWRRRARPQVSVTIGERRQQRLDSDAMLDFRVDLALGDERLSEREMRQLLAGDDGLVHLHGQWVEVDRERLDEALAHWQRVKAEAGADGIAFIEGMRLLAGAPADLGAGDDVADAAEWVAVGAGKWLAEVLARLRSPRSADSAAPAGALGEVLRPYQRVGRDWLWLLANLGLGACLADDMGLGKTVQVIAVLLAFKDLRGRGAKPSLLVLPASLLGNWKAEIKRFAPAIDARFVHRSELDKAALAALATDPDPVLAGADLVVTTYAMLARQPWLLERDWRLAILDEAQAIKNPGARQTRAVKRIRAQARLALTGTPVENRLGDLWSLFDFLCPGLLGSAARFKRFVKDLERREHDRYAPLRALVGPYLLRRLKTDRSIITDLPDKTEVKAFCGLTRKQAALYARGVEELRRTLALRDGIERRGLVLASLMRFKQICNHPSQFLGDGDYAAADSGKFARLGAIAEEIASRQQRALVFTQFREMTGPLAAFLAGAFGRDGLVLHGGTAVGKRRGLVEAFQRDDGPPFLVLSLKAGGVGLNLTAASHVIHFDRWWNPAVENQATDRVFRIGQHRNVVVHKFVCRGTIEERIDALIEDKIRLASDLVDGGAETLLTEMSDEQLLGVVALDVDSASL